MTTKRIKRQSFKFPKDCEPEVIRVTQTAQELLAHGEIIKFQYPPVKNPDGSITEYTTTVTRPTPLWVIEAVLDSIDD